jgi:molybdenum cofactor biosynthesis protein MoaC
MIDVSEKSPTLRTATARAILTAAPATIERVREGSVPKGDCLEVARATAALAVKNTPATIPYCHPIRVDWVGTSYELLDDSVIIDVSVKAVDRTGVEVEAMVGASTAALVIYDMLKMLDDTVAIGGITLVEKRGGKTDWRKVDPSRIQAAVLVCSDSISAGRKKDISGRMIEERLRETGHPCDHYEVVPDEIEKIASTVIRWIDEEGIRLVITTGGTGFPEAARAYGQERTPFSMLSRGRAGVRGDALIVNLPGSRGGVKDSLDALLPGLVHAFKMLHGGGHEEDSRPHS